MRTKISIIAGLVGVIVLVLGAIAVAAPARAQEDQPTPAAGQRTKAFLERVASILGIDPARLRDAIKKAQLDMVDEALANGTINEDQAAKSRERIESGQGLSLLRRAKHRAEERRELLRAGVIKQSADAIGISANDLRGELRDGKSIADVAAEHDVAVDDVKQQILDAAREKLDQAVANGRIEQARADAALQRLTDNLDTMLNKKREAPATP